MSEHARLRPTWLSPQTVLVPALLPEPPAVQRFRGGQPADVEHQYESALSDSHLDSLAKLGANVVVARFFAGFGLEFEKSAQDAVKDAVARAHARGMKAALRIQFGSLTPETLLIEEPECTNWLAVNADGRHPQGDAPFRVRACFNSESYLRFMERVTGLAVDAGADLLIFDDTHTNAEPDVCRCPICVAAFREMLRNQYGSQDERTRQAGRERLSLNTFTHIRPPQTDAQTGDAGHPADAPLVQEWTRFKTRTLSGAVARLSRAALKRNPECGSALTVFRALTSSPETAASLSLGELAPHVELFLAAPELTRGANLLFHGQTLHRADGRGHYPNPVHTLAKTARAHGVALMSVADSQAELDVQLAQDLAFNGRTLSLQGALLRPGWHALLDSDPQLQVLRNYVDFFQRHRSALFGETQPLARVGVLLDGPSLAYGGGGARGAAQAKIALHDAGIPFELFTSVQALAQAARRVHCIVVPGAECLSDDAAKALDTLVLQGHGLVVTDAAGTRDVWRRVRSGNVLGSLLGPEYPRATQREAGLGRVAYVPRLSDTEAFSEAVRFAAGGEAPWRVEADSGSVESNAVQTVTGSLALHVIHSGDDPARGLRCSVAAERAPATVQPLAPGRSYEPLPFSYDQGRVSFSFDELERYVAFQITF